MSGAPSWCSVPVRLAEKLEALAGEQGVSLSDVAGQLITVGLVAREKARRGQRRPR